MCDRRPCFNPGLIRLNSRKDKVFHSSVVVLVHMRIHVFSQDGGSRRALWARYRPEQFAR